MTTCSEVYYPIWSSRGIRGVQCQNRARWMVDRTYRMAVGEWRPVCGVHVKPFPEFARRPITPSQHDHASG